MNKEIRFVVHARLPQQLEVLASLARNLQWSWNHGAIDLFRRIDPDLWDSVGHNPVRLLGEASQERLEALACDDAFLAHVNRVHEGHARYLEDTTRWYRRAAGVESGRPWVAYFSMEFGLTECLPIYSGGLGVLAGDFLKATSDLGLPVVGVGILYQQGYFKQYLNSDGWQQEEYPELDFHNTPVIPCASQDGGPVLIEVPIAERRVRARVWEALLGQTRLLLLDTNLEQNEPDLRLLSFQLYGGDLLNRIRQEILLGIGGVRALAALAIEPLVFHMNEGHSAFLALERMRQLVEKEGLDPEDALEAVRATSVFTTHTPVPAGNDYFSPAMVVQQLGPYAASFGISPERLLGLGRFLPESRTEEFCMTILALRTSAYRNGVSRLHGQVSRAMWRGVWPGLVEDEVPIRHVTNGAHLGTWVNKDLSSLFDSYLGPAWREDLPEASVWNRIRSIPPTEVWRSHERRRERLVGFARQRLLNYYAKRGVSRGTRTDVGEVLDPRALTIGFARRFATYKRADLLFRDPERLDQILNSPGRPVQILFAGKAHPRDEEGKRLIQRLMHFAREERFWSRIVFLENYDMQAARRLVQGVDVWLNLPRRPLEASGTSGMKAVFNGALHLSVLDGWWDEAWHPDLGWAVGKGELYDSPEIQDQVEVSTLYDLLEREVVPLFYARSSDDVPRGWVEIMKASMATFIPRFNSSRMARDYLVDFYQPAARLVKQLSGERYQGARELGAFRRKVARTWDRIRLEDMTVAAGHKPCVGDRVDVQVTLRLGDLAPSEVAVEAVCGPQDPAGRFKELNLVRLKPVSASGPGLYTFSNEVELRSSGSYGIRIRVTPDHPLLCDREGWGFVH